MMARKAQKKPPEADGYEAIVPGHPLEGVRTVYDKIVQNDAALAGGYVGAETTKSIKAILKRLSYDLRAQSELLIEYAEGGWPETCPGLSIPSSLLTPANAREFAELVWTRLGPKATRVLITELEVWGQCRK